MNHIMVDIETLGTKPGCSILSVGAVAFNPHTKELGNTFYSIVSRKSCKSLGLLEEKGSWAFWLRQPEEAKSLIREVDSVAAPHIEVVLDNFAEYLKTFPGDRRIWGNGSDFDNVIIAYVYALTSRSLPWQYKNNRCFRTLKNLLTTVNIETEREGVYHNALDDAIYQAKHAIQLLSHLAGILR